MQPDPLVLAYLAGMIDADGYITVHRGLHGKYLYYGAQVGIAGTRREPHDLAASLFGGKVGCYYPKIAGHLPQFQWSRSGKSAAIVIEAILPFLRVKIDQALTALELHEHMIEGKWPDPYPWFGPHYDSRERCEELYMEAKRLNIRKPRARRTWDEFPKVVA